MQIRLSLIVAMMTGVISWSANAQAPKPGGAPAAQQRLVPEERLKILTASLSLTPAQQEKVRDVYEKNEGPRKKLLLDENLSADDRRAQLRKLSKAERDEINALLTPEQKQKWEELRAKNAANKAKRDAGPAGTPADEK